MMNREELLEFITQLCLKYNDYCSCSFPKTPRNFNHYIDWSKCTRCLKPIKNSDCHNVFENKVSI